MDPLTQGVVGASLAQAASGKIKKVGIATALGWISGMVPDLDILIRSEQDPLLYLEFHRQFTHSFFFIPLGGLLCAAFFYVLLRRFLGLSFGQMYLFCTLGFATHGLLDAATSYGTQLFWPFSSERVAFNTISIIDPLFTLPVLVLILIGIVRKKAAFGAMALMWMGLYMGHGVYQNQRAVAMGMDLAQSRGHVPQDLSAKPSFGNQLVWKIVYRVDETYYVDAVRTGFDPQLFEGASIPALKLERDFPDLDPNSQQARDIERFRWFSKGYVAKDPYHPNRIIDLRYSLIPNEIKGMWSIELSDEAGVNDHVAFLTHRGDARERFGQLWFMLTTKDKKSQEVLNNRS